MKIRCLKGLPLAMGQAGDRYLFKALETFCFIKAIWVNTPFDPSGEAWQRIAQASVRSTKTIKRRVELLKQQGWLRECDKRLEAVSWDDIRERYAIRHTRFYHLTPCQNVQVEYLIKAKVFSEKKEHCRLGYKAHLKREFILTEMIQEVSGTANAETVAEHQLSNFLSEGRLYDQEGAYALNMRYNRKEDEVLRGDMEVNYRTGSKMFGYGSRGGFAVLKRSLAQRGVIQVERRRLTVLKGTNTTTRSRKVRLGFCKWNESLHRLELIMPDKVTLTPNCHVDEHFLTLKRVREHLQNVFGSAAA